MIYSLLMMLWQTNAATNPTVTLNNGVVMPLAACGTWQYNSSTAYEELTMALQVGFTHFDTAHDYNDQDGVGRFFKEAVAAKGRDNLFLTSKVPGCGTAQGVRGGKNCGPDTEKVFRDNLDALGVDHVDMMLIHFPPGGCGPSFCNDIQTQWAVFEDLYAQNLTRVIGVSNYCQSCFECLYKTSKINPAVNQLQYHVGMGADPIGIRSYLKAQDIVMQAYSPLGDGTSDLITGEMVTTIGKAHDKAGVQVSLRWLTQQEVPLVTKADQIKYLQQDIDIFDWDLTESEMATLTAATTPTGTPSFMCKA